MGFAITMSRCFGCGHLFYFNRSLVPRIIADGGVRRPLCLNCINGINKAKVAVGLKPIVIHADAYRPPDENELD